MFRIKVASLALAMLAVSAFFFAPLSAAEPPGANEANLSQEQKTQLRSVMDKTGKDLDALHRQLGDTRKKLFQEFDNYNLNDQKVRDYMRDINKIQDKILRRHLQTQKEIRKVVTPAQFETLKKFMIPRPPWPDRRTAPNGDWKNHPPGSWPPRPQRSE